MTLKTQRGKANNPSIWPAIVGEQVTAAFQGADGGIVLVMESGDALCICSLGGGSPAYWIEGKKEWSRRYWNVRDRLLANQAALERLTLAGSLAANPED